MLKTTFTKRNTKSGFTLVETLIAISILLISISGPLVIISQALKSSYYARDEITAFYLAQEVVEFLRNQRDNNGLKALTTAYYSDTWLNGVGVITDSPASSLINTNTTAYTTNAKKAELVIQGGVYKLKQCLPLGSKCPFLKYGPNGDYAYGDIAAPSNSNFTREIILFEPPNTAFGEVSKNRELIVYVRVFWNTGSNKNSVTIREHITNWELEQAPS